MKSDLARIDWAEPEVDERPALKERSELGMRKAHRVPVRLRVAIATKECAYLAQSVDISETGVLIENYSGPELRRGQRVLAIISGILSDDGSEGRLSPVYVAWVSENRVALSFKKIC